MIICSMLLILTTKLRTGKVSLNIYGHIKIASYLYKLKNLRIIAEESKKKRKKSIFLLYVYLLFR